MQGVPGRTYMLTVAVSGKTYIATSTIPSPVNIDSLKVALMTFGRNSAKVVNVYFQDPPNQKNYYRFVEYHNSVLVKNIFIYDDRIQDGNQIMTTLFDKEDTLRTGDHADVYLQCVDKGAYDYFRTMRLATGAGSSQAASPANPVSNFSNGALGYFSAYSERFRGITIP